MPLAGFMLKEITVKGSLSYTHEDFRQVVEVFKEGTEYVDAMVSPPTTDILVLSLRGKFGSGLQNGHEPDCSRRRCSQGR